MTGSIANQIVPPLKFPPFNVNPMIIPMKVPVKAPVKAGMPHIIFLHEFRDLSNIRDRFQFFKLKNANRSHLSTCLSYCNTTGCNNGNIRYWL